MSRLAFSVYYCFVFTLSRICLFVCVRAHTRVAAILCTQQGPPTRLNRGSLSKLRVHMRSRPRNPRARTQTTASCRHQKSDSVLSAHDLVIAFACVRRIRMCVCVCVLSICVLLHYVCNGIYDDDEN